MARSVACGHGIPVEVSSVHLLPFLGQTLVEQYVIDECSRVECSMMKKFVEQYGCVENFDWPVEHEVNSDTTSDTGTDDIVELSPITGWN